MTTGTRLKAALSLTLALVLAPSLSSAAPKVFGDFEIGKTTLPQALNILKAKPGCNYFDWTTLGSISVNHPETCHYNFPGDATISIEARASKGVINMIRLEVKNLPDCQAVYMPSLEKTWKDPTNSSKRLVTSDAGTPLTITTSYWLEKNIVVLFEAFQPAQGNSRCELSYWTSQAFKRDTGIGKELERIEKEKQKSAKPMTPL